MDTKALIKLINVQIIGLTRHLENDISQLNDLGEEGEKLKAQKCLVDSLHKITNTILQVKRLEKSQSDSDQGDDEKDQLILAEYLKNLQLKKYE